MSIARSESQEQSALVSNVLAIFGNRPDFVRPLFFSTLNGAWVAGEGARKLALLAKYRREGWVNGVADILYLQPRGRYYFLAIELKTEKRRREKDGGLSDHQKDWLAAAVQCGAMVAVAFGFDDAFGAFEDYMGLDPAHPTSQESE